MGGPFGSSIAAEKGIKPSAGWLTKAAEARSEILNRLKSGQDNILALEFAVMSDLIRLVNRIRCRRFK